MMNPGCDRGQYRSIVIAKQSDRRLIETVDSIYRWEQRCEQIGAPLQYTFRQEVEFILIPKARNNLLTHLAHNPPGNVRNQKNAGLSSHDSSSFQRRFRALTAQRA